MRKWLFIGGMFFVAFIAVGFLVTKGPQDVSMPPHEKFEIPEYSEDEDIVRHLGYTASYNHGTLVPDWVAWELTKTEASADNLGSSGFVSRNAPFSRDPDVKEPKACREDYSHSGWDKGHMAPRADMRWSSKALEESFYFTNICPQDHTMNSSAWREIEELTRMLAESHGVVYVVCGPVFNEHRHGTIGEGCVQVPDGFFKALAISTAEGYRTVGFLMDNNPQRNRPGHYAVTVDSVEAVIGRNLFPKGDEAAEAKIDREFWRL